MGQNQGKLLNVVLVAWTSTGGWADVRSALTQAFRNFFPEPAQKQGAKPYDPFEALADEMLPGEGESKVVYCTTDLSSVESTIKHAIEGEEARQIIVAPLLFAMEQRKAPLLGEDIVLRLREIEEQNPDVEIFFVGPPFGSERQIERLLSKIREHEPEAALLLEKVVARGFGSDWALFGRFMEKLQSFLPAETHVAIRGSTVTGYNYNTGIPFDALGKGSSDLDLVLLGQEAISYWEEDGFYIPGILTMPLGDQNADLAPGLEPVRKELEEIVKRPVHMQAMPQWFLELRRAIMKTPYLLLDK
jgi:hypothetical protein